MQASRREILRSSGVLAALALAPAPVRAAPLIVPPAVLTVFDATLPHGRSFARQAHALGLEPSDCAADISPFALRCLAALTRAPLAIAGVTTQAQLFAMRMAVERPGLSLVVHRTLDAADTEDSCAMLLTLAPMTALPAIPHARDRTLAHDAPVAWLIAPRSTAAGTA